MTRDYLPMKITHHPRQFTAEGVMSHAELAMPHSPDNEVPERVNDFKTAALQDKA